MRRMTFFLLLLATMSSAHAHPSLIPHTHPHGQSLLPDLGTLVVASILLFAGGLWAYAMWRRE